MWERIEQRNKCCLCDIRFDGETLPQTLGNHEAPQDCDTNCPNDRCCDGSAACPPWGISTNQSANGTKMPITSNTCDMATPSVKHWVTFICLNIEFN